MTAGIEAVRELEEARADAEARVAELERRAKLPDGHLPCGGCGGPHRFDTSVPSVVWNAVIRAQGLSEYLCTSCIVREFALAGRSFTATLWSGDKPSGVGLPGVPIEVRVSEQVARDADVMGVENSELRWNLRECVEWMEGIVRWGTDVSNGELWRRRDERLAAARAALNRATGGTS